MRFTKEELSAIAERIVIAEMKGKDCEPGYQHGFMIGFLEGIEFLKTCDRKTKMRERYDCEVSNSKKLSVDQLIHPTAQAIQDDEDFENALFSKDN